VIVTRHARHFRAPRSRVYHALIDRESIARWRFPQGMTIEIHELDAREGGQLRISLTHETDGAGKTSERTDTYRGRFVRLVPDEQVVEVDEFETDDPAFQGEMTIAITLSDADGGTDLVAVHEGLPTGIRPEDNEAGWRDALERLAALLEVGHSEGRRWIVARRIASERDAVDVVGDAVGAGAELVVLPVGVLDPEFFRLASGLAGAVLQKLVNYRFEVAIVGDIEHRVATSESLRDFVRESNRHGAVRFVPDMSALP
jgi:uncharacterized protein YndB with AHSA1/START domain